MHPLLKNNPGSAPVAYTGRPSKLVVCGGGGQCTPYKGLYGEGMTDRGTFIRLQVYEKARVRKKWKGWEICHFGL